MKTLQTLCFLTLNKHGIDYKSHIPKHLTIKLQLESLCCTKDCIEYACIIGHTNCVKRILSYQGVKLNLMPLRDLAAFNDHMSTFKELLPTHQSIRDALIDAVQNNQLHIIRYLRGKRRYKNPFVQYDKQTDQILMISAIKEGRINIFQYLINDGVPILPILLKCTIRNGRSDCLRVLLSKNGYCEKSTIELAKTSNSLSYISILKEFGY